MSDQYQNNTNEQNAYILGTDREELHRLGVQHQVWAEEAQRGWANAGFSAGHTILDLGCGPGFCTKELAYIVGDEGKVIAVDRSKNYIDFIDHLNTIHQLPIETVLADFYDLELSPNSLDGMYCRWALAWLSEPERVLAKVKNALKPGGKMVMHEYYDWKTHQTEPQLPALNKAIAAALKSFKETNDGDIDVGRYLPRLLADVGLKVTHIRLMSKVARPNEFIWQWPKTYYQTYFPRLVELNYLTIEEVEQAFRDLAQIEQDPNATLCCPLMVEVIAEKV